ncbi:hypothetical protein BDV30DRAFT_236263 [Aspergillus minisclerotigenes]|uniref:Uncharacterized protein n=1 Tax=Aspergillus minisclerotigenes TaxID=656917 RepID=A0A5N6JDZ8_9EURO|nr:hypothetical protein BDV30DRAFT_236263 [Aspergillus minisclerotigenes]
MSGYTTTASANPGKRQLPQAAYYDRYPRAHIPTAKSEKPGFSPQDIDLERGNGFEPLTMNEAKMAPKKRYIFGIPDSPFEDSESDNEWMRHIDEDEAKPETNNFQQGSEQRRITCCHNTSGLTQKRSSVSCTELSIVIVIMVVAGLIILLPSLLGRAK